MPLDRRRSAEASIDLDHPCVANGGEPLRGERRRTVPRQRARPPSRRLGRLACWPGPKGPARQPRPKPH